MRCAQCDYPLWNLAARACPECGADFRPSQHDFAPNSVRFCCPHCDQPYYGTTFRGHLTPVEFDCVACGRHVHMDEMVLQPEAGIEEHATRPERAPWLHRHERGRWAAWFATIGMALVHPIRLMRGVPPGSSIGQAWWFAILTNAAVSLVAMAPVAVPMAMGPLMMPAAGGPSLPAMVGIMVGAVAVGAVSSLVLTIVSVLLWGVVCHGILCMSGAVAGGIGRTYQALCYSSGANVMTAVPCLGSYFGWVWWVVSAVFMVREGQRVGVGRSVVAVVLFPLVAIVLIVLLYAWLVMTAMAAAGGSTINMAESETTAMVEAVTLWAADHDQRGPEHALALVPAGLTTAGSFVGFGSDTVQSDVPVADRTLDRFGGEGTNRQEAVAAAAAAALPEGVVAHRVGDFVFTYHGIDFEQGDGGLWIAVRQPDPGANVGPIVEPYRCGRLDGTVATVSVTAMAAELEFQNALRAAHGLPPLPDPAVVSHEQPAVSLTPPGFEADQ